MHTQSVNRVVAILFSIVFPGSGQFGNGQWRKGILAILLVFASLYIPVALLGITPYSYVVVWALCLYDAYRVAKQRDQRGESVRWVLLLLGGFLFLITFVVFVGVAIFAFFGKPATVKAQAKQEVEQRLQERYHDEFTVQSSDYSWNTGKYSMKATPKGHPDLSINVWMSDNNNEIDDTYFENVWSQEQQARLSPAVKQKFGGDLLLYSTADPAREFKQDLNSKREVLRYQDMVERYPEQLHQDVRVYQFGSYSAEMENQTLEKTLQLIQHFSEKEKERLDVTICWYDPAVKEKLPAQTGEAMYRYLLSNVDPRPLFEVHIWDGSVPQLKSVEDLKKHI